MTAATVRIPRAALARDWQHAALTAIYVGLTLYFSGFNLQPAWLGVSMFMMLLTGVIWWARTQQASPDERRTRFDTVLAHVAALPAMYLALPLPMMASWFAGNNALSRPPDVNYWQAPGLWLGAISLYLAFLIPWRSIARRRSLRAVLATVPWTEVAIVVFLTLVALGARIVDLVDEPNPFSGDEANFSNQALEVIECVRKNMFAIGTPFGQPSIYYFLQAVFFKVFGVGILASRLPAVLFGVTMIPILYILLREQFDKRVAVVGAAFLAIYHLHIHFSRTGLNNMSAAWIAVLCLYFAARATRTQKPIDFGLAGAVAGLSLYSFVAARAIPLVLALYFGWVVLFNWRFLRDNWGNFLILLAGFLIVAAPQGLYFIQYPDEWNAGSRWANIFANGYVEKQQQATGDSVFVIVVGQFKNAFGLLAVYPEVYHHYAADRPLVDPQKWGPWPGLGFWFLAIGAAVGVYRLRQPRYFVWLALLIVTVTMGAALSAAVDPHPSSARLVAMTPAVAALVAIGIVATADAIARWRPQLSRAAPVLIVAILLALTYINIQFYFGNYLPDDRYVVGDNDITFAVGEYMEEVGPDYAGYWFGAPRIVITDPTMHFIGRDRVYVDVPVGSKKIPPPPVERSELSDATLLFLADRVAEAAPYRAACPGKWREFRDDHDKRVLFNAYEMPNGINCLRDHGLLGAESVEPPEATNEPELKTPEERDAKRRADVEAIRAALEEYYDQEGSYPSSNSQIQTLCTYEDSDAGCRLGNYLQPLPTDPLGEPAKNGYFYVSDGTRYSIFAQLEGPAEAIAPTCFRYDPTLVSELVKLCVTGAREPTP